jgi:hypothetical protein
MWNKLSFSTPINLKELTDLEEDWWMYLDNANRTAVIGTKNFFTDALTLLTIPFGLSLLVSRSPYVLVPTAAISAIAFVVMVCCYGYTDGKENSNTLGRTRCKLFPSFYLDSRRFVAMYTMYHNEFVKENAQELLKHNKLVKFKQDSGVVTIEKTLVSISKDISELNTLSSQIGSQLHQNNAMIDKVKASGMASDLVDKVVDKLESANATLIDKRSKLDEFIVAKKQEARAFTATTQELSNCWLLLDAANCIELSSALVDKAKVAIESANALELETSNLLTGATKEVHALLSDTCKVLA